VRRWHAFSDSRTGDLLFRVVAIGFLGTALLAGVRQLVPALRTLPAMWPNTEIAAAVVARLTSILFVLLMIGLYLARDRAVQKSVGVLPRVTALLATLTIPVGQTFLDPAGALVRSLLGFAMVVTGKLLAILSLVFLGRSFSIMPEARHLVTAGPYGLVRHPLYFAEQVASVGVLLPLDLRIGVPLLVAQLALQLSRIRFEERVLVAQFPEYRDYQRQTPMLIPRIL